MSQYYNLQEHKALSRRHKIAKTSRRIRERKGYKINFRPQYRKSYVSKLSKRVKKQDFIENELTQIGRTLKCTDFKIYAVPTIFNGQTAYINGDGSCILLNNIPLATFGGYGSHTRMSSKIHIKKLQYTINMNPTLLTSNADVDYLRTMIVYWKQPFYPNPLIHTGDYYIRAGDVLGSYDTIHNNFSVDPSSNLNVQNSNQYMVLLDEIKQVICPVGSIVNYAFDILYGGGTGVGTRNAVACMKGEIDNLNLPCEFNELNSGLGVPNLTTGALFILFIGRFSVSSFNANFNVRMFYEDEVVDSK